MKYTEQAVETLDDAGSVIANKNIEIEQLRQRVQELEKEPSVESGGEFKTWWEIALHVGAWKNHELDYVHFGSEMAVRAFAIHLLKQRDKEESQLIQTIAKLTTERDEATQYWQIAEGRCDALKQQRDDLLVAQLWQPINTAPKEGLFLVHRKHTAYPIVAHVYKPYGSICDYVFGELLHNVTHWMPLPPAPAIATVKEKPTL